MNDPKRASLDEACLKVHRPPSSRSSSTSPSAISPSSMPRNTSPISSSSCKSCGRTAIVARAGGSRLVYTDAGGARRAASATAGRVGLTLPVQLLPRDAGCEPGVRAAARAGQARYLTTQLNTKSSMQLNFTIAAATARAAGCHLQLAPCA
jgi:hypothetical protein